MRVVDRLAAEHGIATDKRRFDGHVGEGFIGSARVLLVKPQTYVNLAGTCVAPLLRWYRCPAEDLLVICDDINLELGKLRLRRRGASGGHNGLQSVADRLGTEEFARLRIGIGRGGSEDPVGHVLGRFGPEEDAVIEGALADAAQAACVWVGQGIEAAMNAFNR
jgi:PTH1 family peptidyl-tRNA hydrolase